MNESFAVYNTSIGLIKIGYKDEVVLHINKVDEANNLGNKTLFSNKVYTELEEYFCGVRRKFDLSFYLKGTKFQNMVWRELLNIPYGETRSYEDVAISIGNPKAYRAVGMANNRNPIPIIIPCHRVIGKNGKLIGYALGLSTKEKLLKIEKKFDV